LLGAYCSSLRWFGTNASGSFLPFAMLLAAAKNYLDLWCWRGNCW